ncbi:MAG: recombinase family protein [Parcubacteria group bacterium]|nr:recombinase family protein [Parcubacteria group bacterium]
MSIEAQLFELREYARKENLEILEEFQESKSAKTPGREIFGEMMAKIESDGDFGILAWHPDRLARNSIDGGRIIYTVDQKKIVSLRFPTFWFEPTPQGLFMLQVAFGCVVKNGWDLRLSDTKTIHLFVILNRTRPKRVLLN